MFCRTKTTNIMVPSDFVISTQLPEARLEHNDQTTQTKGVLRTLRSKNPGISCT